MLYVIDNLASYHNQIIILVLVPILFLPLVKFFPETPEFLQKEGHILVITFWKFKKKKMKTNV